MTSMSQISPVLISGVLSRGLVRHEPVVSRSTAAPEAVAVVGLAVLVAGADTSAACRP